MWTSRWALVPGLLFGVACDEQACAESAADARAASQRTFATVTSEYESLGTECREPPAVLDASPETRAAVADWEQRCVNLTTMGLVMALGPIESSWRTVRTLDELRALADALGAAAGQYPRPDLAESHALAAEAVRVCEGSADPVVPLAAR